MLQIFVKISRYYSTRRSGLDILVPMVSTEKAKKGCYYFRAQAFNNLSSSIKEIKCLLIFKTIIIKSEHLFILLDVCFISLF